MKDAKTFFDMTIEQHLERATEFLDNPRLHAPDCSFHIPSAKCSCGLHKAYIDVVAVLTYVQTYRQKQKQDSKISKTARNLRIAFCTAFGILGILTALDKIIPATIICIVMFVLSMFIHD